MCIKLSHWHEALRLLHEMQRRGLVLNIPAYTAAIIACKNGQQAKQAMRLLQEMQYKSIVPDVLRIRSERKGEKVDFWTTLK